MKPLKASIHFPITSGNNGFYFAENQSIAASGYFNSPAIARKKLTRAIEREVAAHLLESANASQRRIIGTKQGEVLLVRFHFGAWRYDIAGPGRGHCSSCSGNGDFQETVQAARKHAESSYGGIAWEC